MIKNMKKIPDTSFKTRVSAVFLLIFMTLFCSALAYSLDKAPQEKLNEMESQSIEIKIASLIKKEFGRKDLEIRVSLTPKKILSKLNANSVSSIKLHFFDGAKQKCRVLIHSGLPKHSALIAQYSFSKLIPVLKRNLKAGEVIMDSDLTLQTCDAPFVEWSGANLVQNKERIIGKYAPVKLKAESPIYIDPFSSISTTPN